MVVDDTLFEDIGPDDGEVDDIVYCWIHPYRSCSAECVAYDARAMTNASYAACRLVNAAAAIAASVSRLVKAHCSDASKSQKSSEEYRRTIERLNPLPPEVK